MNEQCCAIIDGKKCGCTATAMIHSSEDLGPLSHAFEPNPTAVPICGHLFSSGQRCNVQAGHGGSHIWINPVMEMSISSCNHTCQPDPPEVKKG